MKSVLVYSGGLDSTVLLYDLIEQNHKVMAVTFNYGQKHKKEVLYSKANCKELGVGSLHVDLELPYYKSALMGAEPIPEGKYDKQSMKKTVVPNRNAIMLGIAWGVAVELSADMVAIASHGGDYETYPDCRLDFFRALELAFQAGNPDNKIWFHTPYVDRKKSDIVKLGSELGVDFTQTWSCYKGLIKHCGKCGTCIDRREAFKLSGVTDPTDYMEEK